jgi:hypothetical protein
MAMGTPNACSNCHSDKPIQWAEDAVQKWYPHGLGGFQHFGETLHSGSLGALGAQQALGALIADYGQPSIARATAMTLLADYPEALAVDKGRVGVSDVSALVRRATTSAFGDAEPGT